jgi:hypothetical protein
MERLYKTIHDCAAGIFLITAFTGSSIHAQVTQTFTYTGASQAFTVPACVGTITLDVRGGQGANANDRLPTNSIGGLGGRAMAVMTVTPGQVLNIYVGGVGNQNGNGGWNGGGNGGNSTAGSSCLGGPAGGGGGASDIRFGGVALTNRIIVGAGGGGAGRDYCNGTCQPCGCGGSGGGGGGLSGLIGNAAHNCGYQYPGSGVNGGAPGTATAGGLGGPGDSGGNNGFAGTFGQGGAGADGQYDVAGGGGGGGYYGGGGGGAASSGSGVGGGGGGGGSSYYGSLAAGTTTSSFNSGDGIVILTYDFISPVTTTLITPPTLCVGGSATLSASGLSSYTWSPVTSNANSIVVSPASNSSYTVQGITSAGCQQMSVLNVSVSSGPPVLTVNTTTTSVCPNNTVMITATGALQYTISGGISNGVPFVPPGSTNYSITGANGCGNASTVIPITVSPLPVAALSTPTVVCSGNAATLTAAAASNYTWYPNATPGSSLVVSPSVTTTYTVIGTNATCSGSTSVVLNVNPIPTVVAVASSSNICAGDNTTLTASGALSYQWQGVGTGSSVVVSPAVATSYQLIGTNSFGCTSSTSQVVLVKAAPSMNISATSTLVCVGGSVALYASGANTYAWSSGVTTGSLSTVVNSNTVFSVIGTNTTTGCSAVKSVSINVFSKQITLSPSTVVCVGGSVTLNASGANSYTWGPNQNSPFYIVSPSVTTVYMVSATTLTNGMNCISTGTVSVTVNPLPTITAVSTRTSICRNETVTLTASGASTYFWSNFNANASFSYKGNSSGSFTFTVNGTDANGCVNTGSVTLKVSSCTGIEDLQSSSYMRVFPNPNNGIFTVSFSSAVDNVVIKIFDSLGNLVQSVNADSDRVKIDLDKEANGVYLLDLTKDERSLQVIKIIKQ